ncbi:MAG: hypothetical protein AAFQ67_09605, partial [Pseudomonadota bacterium]
EGDRLVVTLEPTPIGRNDAPIRTLPANQVPGLFGLGDVLGGRLEAFAAPYYEDLSTGTPIEAGTLVTDNDGVITDEAATGFTPDGDVFGFQAGLSYQVPNLADFRISFIHGSMEDSQSAMRSAGANQFLGLGFYGFNEGFGSTGVGAPDGDLSSDADIELAIDRLEAEAALNALQYSLNPDWSLTPIVGFQHEDIEQTTTTWTTINTSFGALTQTQRVVQNIDTYGPDFGLQLNYTFGENRGHTLYARAVAQPRFVDFRADATQVSQSGIDFFPLDVVEELTIEDDDYYTGGRFALGAQCLNLFDNKIRLNLEGGVIRRELIQFGRESDGEGRIVTLDTDSDWSPFATFRVGIGF